ncbi:MAG: hypothetical protein JRJ16_15945 [Deltaproteobacteria bacterium]|nr:hypothetical protein [Deltaproteobacteria bacterium]
MAEKAHIPLGVGFYPDWFNENYGISFDRKYYFDPETRVEARMEIERSLHERFGEFGLGSPNPEPKPLITFGMVMLPAIETGGPGHFQHFAHEGDDRAD